MSKNPKQEDKTISLRIFMSESLRNTFKATCAKQGRNMSEVVTEFVESYVKDHDPDFKPTSKKTDN
ncbi:MAG: plasmid partition protein ParG [Sphaerospermopsis kisseleviana]